MSAATLEIIIEPGRRDTGDSPHDAYWCVKRNGELVGEDYAGSESIAASQATSFALDLLNSCEVKS